MDIIDYLHEQALRLRSSTWEYAVAVYEQTMVFIDSVLFFPFLNLVLSVHVCTLWDHAQLTDAQIFHCIARHNGLWLLGMLLGRLTCGYCYPATLKPAVDLAYDFALEIIYLAWPVQLDDFADRLLRQWAQCLVFQTPAWVTYLLLAKRIGPGVIEGNETEWERVDGGFGQVFYSLFGLYMILALFLIFTEHRFMPIGEVLWKWFFPREPVP